MGTNMRTYSYNKDDYLYCKRLKYIRHYGSDQEGLAWQRLTVKNLLLCILAVRTVMVHFYGYQSSLSSEQSDSTTCESHGVTVTSFFFDFLQYHHVFLLGPCHRSTKQQREHAHYFCGCHDAQSHNGLQPWSQYCSKQLFGEFLCFVLA